MGTENSGWTASEKGHILILLFSSFKIIAITALAEICDIFTSVFEEGSLATKFQGAA